MDVDALRAIINSPAASPHERAEAEAQLRKTATDVSRPAPNLEAQLLERIGVNQISEVSYHDIHRFCSERQWSAEAKQLYECWLRNNATATSTVIRLYLAVHHESRTTAKFLLKSLGKRWPLHWVDRAALEDFIQRNPECEDARLVVQEYLDRGTLEHWGRPPRTCDCWNLSDAIRDAKRHNNPQLLFRALHSDSTEDLPKAA